MDDDASTHDDDQEAGIERDDAAGEPATGREADPADESTADSMDDDSEPADVPDEAGDGPPGENAGPAPTDDGTVTADRPPAAGTTSGTDGEPAPDAGDAAPSADDGSEPADYGVEPATDGVEPADDGVAGEADADARPDAGDRVDAGEADAEAAGADGPTPKVPDDVRKYDRFKKMDGAQYERVNEFLRERTYVTAREWAMARLCADFRTETGVEMTKIGENLPALVPFMTDQYTPQAVNQARASFEEKVRKAGATFLYGAMSDFFTADELDDLMYEVTEVAKFLLEVEGVDLSVEEELEAEDRISSVMREVRRSSDALRHDGTECPNCGHEIEPGE